MGLYLFGGSVQNCVYSGVWYWFCIYFGVGSGNEIFLESVFILDFGICIYSCQGSSLESDLGSITPLLPATANDKVVSHSGIAKGGRWGSLPWVKLF